MSINDVPREEMQERARKFMEGIIKLYREIRWSTEDDLEDVRLMPIIKVIVLGIAENGVNTIAIGSSTFRAQKRAIESIIKEMNERIMKEAMK